MSRNTANDDEDHRHPITDTWKAEVKTALASRGRGAAAQLARAIGCSSGQLTDLLGPKSKGSRFVPAIAQWLGWEVPAPALPGSRDTGTIRYLVERANEDQRRYLLDAANMLLRAPEAEATQALRSMLRAFRVPFDPQRDLGAVVKVLVVDPDEKHLRAMERTAADNPKIELVATDNIADALLLIGAIRPNLVVIDHALDGGIDYCRHIKANPSTSTTEVAIAVPAITNLISTGARNAGAWKCVLRPVDLSLLVADLTSS